MISDFRTLQDLLSKGLYLNNLDDMKKICERAMSSGEEPLPVFVLLSVFSGIYNSWDERRVPVEEAKQTEATLMPLLKQVVTLIDGSSDRNELWDALNSLVKAYIHI